MRATEPAGTPFPEIFDCYVRHSVVVHVGQLCATSRSSSVSHMTPVKVLHAWQYGTQAVDGESGCELRNAVFAAVRCNLRYSSHLTCKHVAIRFNVFLQRVLTRRMQSLSRDSPAW